tara:strand:+ start:1335 stop:1883 length:549 start_codon:yes stop_codon:yes gene_type:complete
MVPFGKRVLTTALMSMLLAGCQSNLFRANLSSPSDTISAVEPQIEILSTSNQNATMSDVAAINETLDASVMEIPTINAVGYAVVSSQPGRSENQKRLMAIRSARMAAMRELAEQIHGLKVEGNTTVIDLMVQNDTFRGVVTGTIRGARTVRINPTGSDTYEVVLEIDNEMISGLIKSARKFS